MRVFSNCESIITDPTKLIERASKNPADTKGNVKKLNPESGFQSKWLVGQTHFWSEWSMA